MTKQITLAVAKSNLNAKAICDSFAALERGDNASHAARVLQFAALRKAGLGQSIPQDMREAVKAAVLTAWQGAAFTAWFNSDKSKGGSRKGKSRDAFGNAQTVTLSRTDWSKRLGSKLSKLETAYGRWLDAAENEGETDENGNARGAPSSPAVATLKAITTQRDKIMRMIDAARKEGADKMRAQVAAFGDARAIVKALDQAIACFPKK